jgi:hypothetical protein
MDFFICILHIGTPPKQPVPLAIELGVSGVISTTGRRELREEKVRIWRELQPDG